MPRISPRMAPWLPADPAGAADDGRQRAARLIQRVTNGASDPDCVLRGLLDCAAESGRVIPPDTRLRAFCSELQERIARPPAVLRISSATAAGDAAARTLEEAK